MYSIEKRTKDGHILLIREAQASDANVVLEYIDHVSRETDYLTFGPGEFGRSLEEVAGYMESCLVADNSLYLLALIDEEIVGSLTFSAGIRPRVRHTGEFGISVSKEYWGIGVASSMIDSLIDWAMKGNIIKKSTSVSESTILEQLSFTNAKVLL